MTEHLPKVAPDERMLRIVNTRATLPLVIRGHGIIDAALAVAISESLPIRHSLQVRRLDASLKIDLAIAMGLVSGDARPPLQKLNSIRNRFAHDPDTRFTKRQATDFRNTFAGHLKKMLDTCRPMSTSRDVLASSIAILHVVVTHAIAAMRDDRVAVRELARMTSETVARLKARSPDIGASHRAGIDAVVAAARKSRQDRGEY